MFTSENLSKLLYITNLPQNYDRDQLTEKISGFGDISEYKDFSSSAFYLLQDEDSAQNCQMLLNESKIFEEHENLINIELVEDSHRLAELKKEFDGLIQISQNEIKQISELTGKVLKITNLPQNYEKNTQLTNLILQNFEKFGDVEGSIFKDTYAIIIYQDSNSCQSAMQLLNSQQIFSEQNHDNSIEIFQIEDSQELFNIESILKEQIQQQQQEQNQKQIDHPEALLKQIEPKQFETQNEIPSDLNKEQQQQKENEQLLQKIEEEKKQQEQLQKIEEEHKQQEQQQQKIKQEEEQKQLQILQQQQLEQLKREQEEQQRLIEQQQEQSQIQQQKIQQFEQFIDDFEIIRSENEEIKQSHEQQSSTIAQIQEQQQELFQQEQKLEQQQEEILKHQEILQLQLEEQQQQIQKQETIKQNEQQQSFETQKQPDVQQTQTEEKQFQEIDPSYQQQIPEESKEETLPADKQSNVNKELEIKTQQFLREQQKRLNQIQEKQKREQQYQAFKQELLSKPSTFKKYQYSSVVNLVSWMLFWVLVLGIVADKKSTWNIFLFIYIIAIKFAFYYYLKKY